MRKLRVIFAILLVFAMLLSVGCGSSVPSDFSGDYKEKTLAEAQALTATLTDKSTEELINTGIKLSLETTMESAETGKKEQKLTLSTYVDATGKFTLSASGEVKVADGTTIKWEGYYADGYYYLNDGTSKRKLVYLSTTQMLSAYGINVSSVDVSASLNEIATNLTNCEYFIGAEQTANGTKIKISADIFIPNVVDMLGAEYAAYGIPVSGTVSSKAKSENYWMYDANNVLTGYYNKSEQEMSGSMTMYGIETPMNSKSSMISSIVPNSEPITAPTDLASYIG